MYLVGDAEIPTADAPQMLPEDADAAMEYPTDAYFSNRTFLEGGLSRTTAVFRNDKDDASCVAIHGTDTWHCQERNHLLAHHVTAPSFTRMAQRDKSGKDSPGSNHMHSFELCRIEETPYYCYDWVDEEYRQRTFQQALNITATLVAG